MFNRILVVCVGNICRSPTAEYLLRHKLQLRSDLRHSRESGNPSSGVVESAGIGALVGKPMDQTASSILAEQGIDGSAHRARQVSSEMLQNADLILTMEEKHLQHLYDIAPEVRGRAFLLSKWDGEQSIPDPYRQERPAFEHVYGLIDKATTSWLKYL